MTGGYNYDTGGRKAISSTELLEKNGASWTLFEASLPTKLVFLKTVSINNQIFVSGGLITNIVNPKVPIKSLSSKLF